MAENKLIDYKVINVEIEVLTGLHIGAGNNQLEIGGIDNPVVKLKNNEPYIPGSSLKGKLRSLFEVSTGKVHVNNKKYGDIYHLTEEDYGKEEDYVKIDDLCNDGVFISKFFGCVLSKKLERNKEEILMKVGPTRAIFRDLYINEDSRKLLERYEDFTGSKLENKVEVSLARFGFKKGGLRNIERVPKGVKFEGKLIVRLFKIDNSENTNNGSTSTNGGNSIVDDKGVILFNILKMFRLLSLDYLGGGGTRGNGQVKITLTLEEDGNDNGIKIEIENGRLTTKSNNFNLKSWGIDCEKEEEKKEEEKKEEKNKGKEKICKIVSCKNINKNINKEVIEITNKKTGEEIKLIIEKDEENNKQNNKNQGDEGENNTEE